MKVSDYIAKRLVVLGVKRCFSVTGGGAMHLNDSFGEATGMSCTYMHHEQACAIAAEGYARLATTPAVVNVTSGPGAINALNGVFGAYTDSIPMIVVSGQVKQETLLENMGDIPLRQLGDQEARSEAYIPTFVKSFISLRSAKEVIEALDNAFLTSISGRPGPCWIEVPVDIQGSYLEILEKKIDQPLRPCLSAENPVISETECLEFAKLLIGSSRPLLMLGTGVRLSKAETDTVKFAEELNIPIVTAWTHDTVDNNHRLFVGRPGTIGTRPGNFAVQSCDLLIVLGSRLNIRQVSYNWVNFAKHAKIILVDIDQAELKKPYLKISLPINSDISDFIQHSREYLKANFNEAYDPEEINKRSEWIKRLKQICHKYNSKPSDYITPPTGNGINPYHFIFSLSRQLYNNQKIICGDATACITPFQTLSLQKYQRMFSNSGCASMGYDLPAGIGAGIAMKDKCEKERIIILAGDGSIMMNLQEMQTLASSNLDIALFILDNNGYLSIKQTQSNFFKREHGASPESGVTFPNFKKVANAFGLPVTCITENEHLDLELKKVIREMSGPRVCVVHLYDKQEFEPRLKSRMTANGIITPDLDDMFPHLEMTELESTREYLISAICNPKHI